MPDLVGPQLHRFDNFLLDRQAGTLARLHPDGRQTGVQIGSRAFQILCLLADRRGEIVSQRDIMDAVWPNVAVEPNNLTVQLSALRRVLDTNGGQGSCIQNIPGRGYRFVPTITQMALASLDFARATPAGDDHSDPPEPTGSATGDRQMLAASHFAAESTPAAAVRGSPSRPGRSRLVWVAALCLCIAALSARAIWQAEPVSPLQTEAAGGSAAAAPMERPRLSAVVLPFNNLGGEGVDEDTVDSVTEDLTTDLSRLPSVLVIARNSAFTYKGKPIDVKRVGEELGVRYAVEGSVRRVDGTLRVNVQLVATETGTHIWAERFDVRRDGVGYSVDDIVRHIAFALNVRIVDTEAARSLRERPSNPDVADILLRARSVYNRPMTPQRLTELVSLYERALELDPRSATALAGLAEALLDTITYDDPSTPEKIRRAEELLKRAELSRPDDMMVMWTRVYLLGRQDRCPEVMAAAQRAVDAYPILTGSRQWQAMCLTRMGKSAEAISPIEQAIRIAPRNPDMAQRYRTMGSPLLALGRYDEAVVWFQRSLAANPNGHADIRGNTYSMIAAAQALADHPEEARLSAAEATRLAPTLTVRSFFPFTVKDPVAVAQVARVRDGMRLAGIRDHADEDADFGLEPDSVLHINNDSSTPAAVPGAQTIRTPDLVKLLEQRKPLVIDTINWGRSIPGAVGLWGAGIGGSLSDKYQDRLARKMQQLTRGDRTLPIIAMGWNAERYQGRNLALRLVALGYSGVYWYRGGREAWEVADLPETDLVMQDW